jgi:hypothetical protein
VCCVAEALGVTWEEALEILGPPQKDPAGKDLGYLPHEVYNRLNLFGKRVELLDYNYRGSLTSTILQVSKDSTRHPHHFVWIDAEGELHCPVGHFDAWARINGVGLGIKLNS